MTVIIPTRHRPEQLRRAVESVMAQTYDGPIRCLVVFDGEDPSRPAVDLPAGRSLDVTGNNRKAGLPGARNTGILAADTPLVAFLDDDDEWLPTKLARQVPALLADPAALMATCGGEFVQDRRRFTRLPAPRVDRTHLMRSRFMVVHSSTLLLRRAEVLRDVGLVDEEIPGGLGEDYDLLLRTTERAPIVGVMAPLVRIHWGGSYFVGRWQTLVPALQYILAKHPELLEHHRNASRMLGRISFGLVAGGRRREALAYARRSIRLDPRQVRGYLTLFAVAGVPAGAISRVMHALGKSI